MVKITDTQTLILSAAAQRAGQIAMPLPKGIHGAVAKMVVTKMIANGWLAEVEANLRRGEPLWRETGDGHGTTLVATEAGMMAVGIEPVVAAKDDSAQKAQPDTGLTRMVADTVKPVAVRAGTKQAQIIAMLQRPEGATIAEMVAATGWQGHTLRGAISGALKKKLRLPIKSSKEDNRGSVYRIV